MKNINLNNNRDDMTKFVKEVVGKVIEDGIECDVVVEIYDAIYPYPHEVRKVWLEPTEKGKKAKEYIKVKQLLKDDWSYDITETWSEPEKLPSDVFMKIAKIFGYD